MILTPNVEAFGALPPETLALLAPIETDEAYETALAASEQLSHMISDGNTALTAVFFTLVERISAYEEETYPLPDVPPHEILAYLMRQRDLSQTELAQKLGTTQATVSRLISGQTKLTTEWVSKLADALGVDGSLFL